MYKITQAITIGLFTLAISMFAAAGHHGMKKDIVDTAVAAGDFNTLVTAVKAAGLVETLKGEGPFTVFAPTDAAFTAYLTANGLTAADLLANPKLSNILLHHVVSGNVLSLIHI